jgi:hypothetical protein
MFPRDDPDLDSPATDANDESDHVPTHCPNCQLDRPCELHSRKRLHGSDRDDPSKRHKGRLGRPRLHLPLDQSDSNLGRRGKIRTHSDSDENVRKQVKLNLRPQSNQKNPNRVISNNRHGLRRQRQTHVDDSSKEEAKHFRYNQGQKKSTEDSTLTQHIRKRLRAQHIALASAQKEMDRPRSCRANQCSTSASAQPSHRSSLTPPFPAAKGKGVKRKIKAMLRQWRK